MRINKPADATDETYKAGLSRWKGVRRESQQVPFFTRSRGFFFDVQLHCPAANRGVARGASRLSRDSLRTPTRARSIAANASHFSSQSQLALRAHRGTARGSLRDFLGSGRTGPPVGRRRRSLPKALVVRMELSGGAPRWP